MDYQTITPKEAYRAMFLFLQTYYEQTQSDDVGALLGSMSMLEDDTPADAAMWNDWTDAIARATREGSRGA